MKTFEQGIHFSPDEGGGAAEEEEGFDYPETIEIDGKEVPFDEIVNGFKFNSANHERAEEIRREREELRAERAQAEQRLQEQQGKFLEILDRFAPEEPTAQPAQPAPLPVSFKDMVGDIDLVGDEEAAKKLGERWDEAMGKVQQTFEQRLDSKTSELSRTFEEKLSNTEHRSVQRDARAEADAYNSRLFDDTLAKQYPELLEQLDDSGKAELKRTFESQVGKGLGMFDEADQWRWSPEAVNRAVWADPGTRKLMIAKESAVARSDGLQGRVRGERASDSTPTRRRRTTSAGSDDALVEKLSNLQQRVESGEITRGQVEEMLTTAEAARILEMRRERRAQLQGTG